MATVEDILEENAWRGRNGLDDLAWNPEAVAPPLGDVYERERAAGVLAGELARIAFVGMLLAFAAFLWWAK